MKDVVKGKRMKRKKEKKGKRGKGRGGKKGKSEEKGGEVKEWNKVNVNKEVRATG